MNNENCVQQHMQICTHQSDVYALYNFYCSKVAVVGECDQNASRKSDQVTKKISKSKLRPSIRLLINYIKILCKVKAMNIKCT